MLGYFVCGMVVGYIVGTCVTALLSMSEGEAPPALAVSKGEAPPAPVGFDEMWRLQLVQVAAAFTVPETAFGIRRPAADPVEHHPV